MADGRPRRGSAADLGVGDHRRGRTGRRHGRPSRSGSSMSPSPMPAGVDVRRFQWTGDRAGNKRRRAPLAALELLLRAGRGRAGDVTRDAPRIAAGLAAAAPGPADPSPGRASTSSASAGGRRAGAALHAARGRRGRDRVRRGRAGPADTRRRGGRRSRSTGAHDAGHIATRRRGRVDRLAVTKARHLGRARPPRAAGRAGARDRAESVQQVIADAAATGGRRLIGVTGTHGKSTTSGWLLHLLAAAGRDPSGVRRGAAAARRSPARRRGVARCRAGAATSSSRPTSTRATSIPTDRPSACSSRPSGTTRTCSRTRTASPRRSRDWIRRSARWPDLPDGGPILVANVGDPGVRGVAGALAGWPGRIGCASGCSTDDATPRLGRIRRSVAARRRRRGRDGRELEIVGLRPTATIDRVRIRLGSSGATWPSMG